MNKLLWIFLGGVCAFVFAGYLYNQITSVEGLANLARYGYVLGCAVEHGNNCEEKSMNYKNIMLKVMTNYE